MFNLEITYYQKRKRIKQNSVFNFSPVSNNINVLCAWVVEEIDTKKKRDNLSEERTLLLRTKTLRREYSFTLSRLSLSFKVFSNSLFLLTLFAYLVHK